MSLRIINSDSLLTYPYVYPVLISKAFLEEGFYRKLKADWPDFRKFRAEAHYKSPRRDVVTVKGNKNYLKLNETFRQLFDLFDSRDFRNFLFGKFNIAEARKNGLTESPENSILQMSICEATDGYETPWHVDTRRRIIHFLIYFGSPSLQGGEFGIAEHRKERSILHYKQYPNLMNLRNARYFSPHDNVAVFILSQNDSYHRACKTKGLRRFVYCSYNAGSGYAWKTGKWGGHSK